MGKPLRASDSPHGYIREGYGLKQRHAQGERSMIERLTMIRRPHDAGWRGPHSHRGSLTLRPGSCAGRAALGVVALLAAAVVGRPAAAQPAPAPPARFDHLTGEDGLPQSNVWAVLQDRTGFVWFGTQDGLARFDGYDFRVYRPDPADASALGAAHVWALAEDDDGYLWAGTDGGGLSRYDPRTDRFTTFRADPADPGSLCGDEVLSLAVGPGGALWVGTTEGVCRLDPGADRFARPPGTEPLRSHSALGLAVAALGGVWVAGGGYGLYRYRPGGPDGGTLDAFAHDPQDPSTPPEGWAHTVAECGGTTWVGFESGLARYDPRSNTFTRYASFAGLHVRALTCDPDGTLWIGSYGGGLYRVAPGAAEPVPFAVAGEPGGLPSDDVGALHVDRAGNVWVGLVGAGAARWSPRSAAFAHLRPVPAAPYAGVVRGIAEAGGVLWAATGAGLQRLDPAAGRYAPPEGALGCAALPYARAVEAAPDGALWLGSYEGGLCRYDPGTGAAEAFRQRPGDPAALGSNTVFAVAVDAAGSVWAGTDAGLHRLDVATGDVEHVRLERADTTTADRTVNALVVGRDGRVWAGTSTGLYRHDPASGDVLHHDAAVLGTAPVSSLFEDAGGAVWAGTGAGLVRVGLDGAVTRYGAQEGLPGAAVLGIVDDAAGRIWASTTRGLLRLDPGSGLVSTFDRRDGLPFEEFRAGRAHRDGEGRLYFGGQEGLVAVAPAIVEGEAPEPPVVLTAFEAFGAGDDVVPAIWAADEVALAPGHDDFAFEYAALGAPGRVRYAYRLDGWDDGWVEAGGRRFASYANVAPGAYTFRVRATTAGGAWGAAEAAVRVVVEPHWWQTAWARLLALALMVGVAVVLYRWRVRGLLAVEQTRRRIADDLHDDVGSRVSSIALAVELAALSPDLADAERSRLAATATAARTLVADLRDVIWVIDSGSDALADLVERIGQVSRRMLQGIPHSVVVVPGGDAVPDVELALEARRDVLMVVKEALHNALRHAGATRIEVEVRARAGELSVEVRDDGRGLPPDAGGAERPTGRGLKTMRERAHRLGGRLTMESAPGAGTRVLLVVPLGGYARTSPHRTAPVPGGASPRSGDGTGRGSGSSE